jgi:hypothetical protein
MTGCDELRRVVGLVMLERVRMAEVSWSVKLPCQANDAAAGFSTRLHVLQQFDDQESRFVFKS